MELSEINQERLIVLEDTVKYYSEDVNRRCVSKTGGCFYDPKRIGKENISDGCAIGRLINQEKREILESSPVTSIGNIFNNNYEILPENIKRLGKSFCESLQSLHDNRDNWTKTGLSEYGKQKVRIIKSIILSEDYD